MQGNSTGWHIMRQLQTDDERYRCVRERWRSLKVPDSSCVLQRQTYRRRTVASMVSGQPRGVKRRAAEPGHPAKRQRTQSDETLGGVVRGRIAQLERRYDHLIHKANHDHARNGLHARLQLERERRRLVADLSGFGITGNQRMMIEWRWQQQMLCHRRRLRDIVNRHGQRLENIRCERERAILKLEKSLGELVMFEDFYSFLKNSDNENRNLRTLSFCQVVETEEVDHMFEHYDRYYPRS